MTVTPRAPKTPQDQTSRGRSNCKCGDPCFYCGREVVGRRHEHDHMPVPFRHGGTHTVVACIECHRMKDGISFLDWSPAAQHAATTGEPNREPWLFTAMVGAAMSRDANPDPDAQVTPDDCLWAVEHSTHPEGRIAVAKLYAQLLDVQKEPAESREQLAGRMSELLSP